MIRLSIGFLRHHPLIHDVSMTYSLKRTFPFTITFHIHSKSEHFLSWQYYMSGLRMDNFVHYSYPHCRMHSHSTSQKAVIGPSMIVFSGVPTLHDRNLHFLLSLSLPWTIYLIENTLVPLLRYSSYPNTTIWNLDFFVSRFWMDKFASNSDHPLNLPTQIYSAKITPQNMLFWRAKLTHKF